MSSVSSLVLYIEHCLITQHKSCISSIAWSYNIRRADFNADFHVYFRNNVSAFSCILLHTYRMALKQRALYRVNIKRIPFPFQISRKEHTNRLHSTNDAAHLSCMCNPSCTPMIQRLLAYKLRRLNYIPPRQFWYIIIWFAFVWVLLRIHTFCMQCKPVVVCLDDQRLLIKLFSVINHQFKHLHRCVCVNTRQHKNVWNFGTVFISPVLLQL